MNKTRFSHACLAVVVSTATACGDGIQLPSKRIVIGALVDRTGNNAEPSWRDAIRLAFSHANEGIQGRPRFADTGFEIAFSDSVNEPSLALPRARALVNEKGARALIVDTSQVDIALNQTFYDLDTANDLNVPLQCGDCGSSAVNSSSVSDPDPIRLATYRNTLRWNFRASMSCKKSVLVLMRELIGKGFVQNGDVNFDGKFKIGVAASNEPYGQACIKEIRTYAARFMAETGRAIPILVEEVYHPRDADSTGYRWRQDLEQLTDAAPDGIPDAIIVVTFAEYHTAFTGNYKGSYSIPVYHLGSFRIRSVLQALGTLAEGEQGVSSVAIDEGESGAFFSAVFEEATSLAPSYLDATYYDNAFTFLLASVIAARERDDPSDFTGAELRDALARTSTTGGEVIRPGPEGFARAVELIEAGQKIDYAGASGPMDYDDRNNVLDRVARFRVEEGRFVEVARFDCLANPKDCPLVP